jgi:hypothetical protein
MLVRAILRLLDLRQLALEDWCHRGSPGIACRKVGEKPNHSGKADSYRCPENDARHKIAQWKQDYNQIRPHSALGYRTPEEFAKSAMARNCGKDAGGARLENAARVPLNGMVRHLIQLWKLGYKSRR